MGPGLKQDRSKTNKKIQWFCKSSGFAKGFLEFYLSKPMKTYENTPKIIVFMKIYDFRCVFIGFHRFWEVKLKEALSKTITFAKSPFFSFFASILFQPRSPTLASPPGGPSGKMWGALEILWGSGEGLEGFVWLLVEDHWEAVEGSWDTLGEWGGSGRLCLVPGREVSKLWELCGTLGNYLDSWGVLGNPLKLSQESAGLGKPWNLFNDPMQCL